MLKMKICKKKQETFFPVFFSCLNFAQFGISKNKQKFQKNITRNTYFLML